MRPCAYMSRFFFFQAEDGIRDLTVTGVQTCALPICVMYDVVVELLRDYLPAGQDFVIRNLNAMVDTRHRVQVVSLVILLVTSSGVFKIGRASCRERV